MCKMEHPNIYDLRVDAFNFDAKTLFVGDLSGPAKHRAASSIMGDKRHSFAYRSKSSRTSGISPPIKPRGIHSSVLTGARLNCRAQLNLGKSASSQSLMWSSCTTNCWMLSAKVAPGMRHCSHGENLIGGQNIHEVVHCSCSVGLRRGHVLPL